jgi:hypothetical protein
VKLVPQLGVQVTEFDEVQPLPHEKSQRLADTW